MGYGPFRPRYYMSVIKGGVNPRNSKGKGNKWERQIANMHAFAELRAMGIEIDESEYNMKELHTFYVVKDDK